jgi:hypothetical protein
MATKKKAKKAKKSKPVSRKKTTAAKRTVKKTSGKKKAVAKKKVAAKKRPSPTRKTRSQNTKQDRVFEEPKPRTRSGNQSGDLQGLRDIEGADSESVDELVEEGNAFEATVISGVEEADGEETREVHTHEVPEDDVPEEYLDKD